MNLFALAFLLLLIPIIFQLIFGNLSIAKRITFAFEYVSLLNLLFQIIFIFLALEIVGIDMQNQNMRCGMPLMAMLFGGVFLMIILLVIIIIQLLVRRKINRNKSRDIKDI